MENEIGVRKIFLGISLVFVLTLLTAVTQAQAANVEELERKLQERDKVILELLERVEKLERRVGVQQSISSPKDLSSSEKNIDQSSDQAPGKVVVEEGAEERALERSLTKEGALLLSPGVLEAETRLTYIRQEDRSPVFIPSGNDVSVGETELNVDNWIADLQFRLGLPWDSQFEIGLPYRWRQVESVENVNFVPINNSSESASGLGDLRIGFAKTLIKEGFWNPDIIGRITWDTDTGKDHDNGVSLGGGFNELRGTLTAIKRQDPVAFLGSLSYEHTFEDNDIQPGSIISSNLGGNIALSPETALSIFFGAAYQNETEVNGKKIEGSDRTIGTFQLGGSTLLARGTLLSLSGGMGLTDDADDFSISFSLTKQFNTPLF
jgi:hypothetical protein